MRDADLLGWIRDQAAGAGHVLSVCTGALSSAPPASSWGDGRPPTGTPPICCPGSEPSRWMSAS